MKCVIYARVSSKEREKEGFSIPAQQKLLREYAAKQGIKVAQEFTDVETAKTAGRAQFGKMVEYLKVHLDVKIILVEKTDRLYRNFRDYLLLEDLNIEIHLVKENEIISKDSRSHAKFIHGIKVLMAKNYIDNLSEEVKKGCGRKRNKGNGLIRHHWDMSITRRPIWWKSTQRRPYWSEGFSNFTPPASIRYHRCETSLILLVSKREAGKD